MTTYLENEKPDPVWHNISPSPKKSLILSLFFPSLHLFLSLSTSSQCLLSPSSLSCVISCRTWMNTILFMVLVLPTGLLRPVVEILWTSLSTSLRFLVLLVSHLLILKILTSLSLTLSMIAILVGLGLILSVLIPCYPQKTIALVFLTTLDLMTMNSLNCVLKTID